MRKGRINMKQDLIEKIKVLLLFGKKMLMEKKGMGK